jgi:RecJ-like exonuclease
MRRGIIVAVVLCFALAGCKKKEGESSPVEDAVKTAAKVATGAAEGAQECPECPVCAECPTCPVCPTCPECPKAGEAIQVAIGGTATVEVPPPEGFAFTIAEKGEYQIDVMSSSQDPTVRLYKGDERLADDDDGGGNKNSRMYAFLEPGDYSVRVREYDWLPFSAQVRIQVAPPMTSSGVAKPGETLAVQVNEGSNIRDTSAMFTLEIAEQGIYRIDATATGDTDPYLMLVIDNAIAAENDDVEQGNVASRIERAFAPGNYEFRVRDLRGRSAPITIAVAKQ